MPRDTREPQSYGSGGDWLSGKTGQEVNPQKSEPAPEHREFYDNRRESETSAPDQGGRTSPVQVAESAQLSGSGRSGDESVRKVTAQPGGAKRTSYFKKRDYE